MDLRKKTSPVRSLGEILLRFRLIFVAIFAILYVVFARDFRAILSYAQASVVYTLGVFGQETSFSPLNDFALLASAVGVAVFLICFLFVRVAALKTLLPALLVAFFWTALSARENLPFAEYLAFLLVDFLGIFTVGVLAGFALGKGAPVAGALSGGFSKVFIPVLFLHLLAGGVLGYLFREDAELCTLVLFPFISLFSFLCAEFTMFSFAPMGKLRAEHRTMKI